jgi:hypothetical protein
MANIGSDVQYLAGEMTGVRCPAWDDMFSYYQTLLNQSFSSDLTRVISALWRKA